MGEADSSLETQPVTTDSSLLSSKEGQSSLVDESSEKEVVEDDLTWIPPTSEAAAPLVDMVEREAPSLAEIGPFMDLLKGLGDQLSGRLDSLQSILEREQRAEASRERVVDRLHAELQEYKQDLMLKVQRPIFIDLIQLHDDIGKMIEARAPDDGTDPERSPALRGILESVQTAIEDILYRQGVEPFSVEGNAFDPRRQRAVSTVLTDDPARNKTIRARLRKGFQAADKLIRAEIVSVYTVRT